MEKNAKIFVAGHRGLVGSAISRELRAQGYTNLLERTRTELDLMDSEAVARFFTSEKPEYVFLAAAHVGGIAANNTYRAEFIYNNLVIQNNIVHQSYVNQVKKLLFLGSTCIYPRDCPQPIKEDYLLTAPLEYTNEPYAIAKIAGIKLCESYNLQYGTNYISAMPTNLYGPNDNFDLEKAHVLPALVRKLHLAKSLEAGDWAAIRSDLDRRPVNGVSGQETETAILEVLEANGVRQTGKEVTVAIWGSGKPMREFLWVEDMAQACVFLMQQYDFSEQTKGMQEVRNTHINLGTGNDVTIAELAHMIKGVVGFRGAFEFDASKPDGTMRKLTNVSKINSMGWKAATSLDEGLQKMYAAYLAG